MVMKPAKNKGKHVRTKSLELAPIRGPKKLKDHELKDLIRMGEKKI